MSKKLLGLFLVFFLCIAGSAFAENKDMVQLALWNPVQLFPASDSIKGLRLDLLYTNNLDVSGVTLGTGWSRTRGNMKGLSLGAVNWTDGLSYGFKGALFNYARKNSVGVDLGLLNVVRADTTGAQMGVGNWNSGFFHGFQFAGVNEVNGHFVGFQSGALNYAGKMSGLQVGFFNTTHSYTMTGLQLGLINYASEVKGLQLGVFNMTNTLNGLQIGLINYNGAKDPLEYMLLVNWSF